MREAIREVDAGQDVVTPEEDKKLDREAALGNELYEQLLRPILLTFARAHPDAGFEVTVPALLRAAALHAMVGAEMAPEDFGVFAEAVARQFEDEAIVIRAGAARVTRAKGDPS